MNPLPRARRQGPFWGASLGLLLAGCSATVSGTSTDADFDVDATLDDTPDVADRADLGPDATPPENCATPFDDNGDGRANEDCPCPTPGAMQPCFERPEPIFQGLCRMGQQTCGTDGVWGTCVGSWLPDAAERCQLTELFSDTTVVRRAVDIIWFVDTSGSMDRETAAVNENLNRFASVMATSGLDYHVVMIARRGTGRLRVCVPPPLGGASCTDGPRFLHVDQPVSSSDGLRRILSSYTRWEGFLRPESARYFVAVTDDESNLSADEFDRMLRVQPGWDGYTFNSIVGYESRTDCPTLARRGSVYLTLTDRTGGSRARVCDTDWSRTFDAFARGIASRVSAWTLSQRPRPDTIQVWITEPSRTPRRLTTGWTYDPVTNRVTLDPDSIPMAGSFIRVFYRIPALSP